MEETAEALSVDPAVAASATGAPDAGATGTRPSLVVSDLDGTLLTSADRVSPRTREVIGRIVASGARFIPASGRPARWMLPVVEQLGITPVCVCANGAVVYDAATDRITYAAELAPAVLRRVTSAIHAATAAPLARAGLGPVSFAVERTGTSAFDRVDRLFAVEPSYPHAWESEEHAVEVRDRLCSEPAVKLLVRHGDMGSAEMFDLVNPVVDPVDAHVTWSFDGGLLEVNVPGVTKLSGLAHALGDASGADVGVDAVPSVDPADVVAFGDMPNDLAMLRWAGHGYAMGNAVDEVTAAAEYRTGSNDDDGVAQVLERWF